MTATKITAAELHRRHTAQKKAKIAARICPDAICPACKAPLHGTSHLLREPIVVHGEPLFTRSPGAVLRATVRKWNLSQEDIAALQKNNAYLNGVAAKALAGKLK